MVFGDGRVCMDVQSVVENLVERQADTERWLASVDAGGLGDGTWVVLVDESPFGCGGCQAFQLRCVSEAEAVRINDAIGAGDGFFGGGLY